jgi:hypothetical protein
LSKFVSTKPETRCGGLSRPQGWNPHTGGTGHGFDVNKMIDYLGNSGDIFSRYPDRLALSFVVDHTPQFGNTAPHYYVE